MFQRFDELAEKSLLDEVECVPLLGHILCVVRINGMSIAPGTLRVLWEFSSRLLV